MKPVRAVSQHLFNQWGADTGVYHWRGKEIAIESDPPQDVWIDGELGGQTPFTVSAMPQALEIVVPA
jgi:diacylglycerol kinase family enzyme